MSKKKHELLPGWNTNSPIPEVVIGVSVDTYYNLLKKHAPGFTWSFEISKDELYDVQCEVMDFLSYMTDKNLLGRVSFRLQTQKIGELKQLLTQIEYVKRTDNGWIIGDTY